MHKHGSVITARFSYFICVYSCYFILCFNCVSDLTERDRYQGDASFLKGNQGAIAGIAADGAVLLVTGAGRVNALLPVI